MATWYVRDCQKSLLFFLSILLDQRCADRPWNITRILYNGQCLHFSGVVLDLAHLLGQRDVSLPEQRQQAR